MKEIHVRNNANTALFVTRNQICVAMQQKCFKRHKANLSFCWQVHCETVCSGSENPSEWASEGTNKCHFGEGLHCHHYGMRRFLFSVTIVIPFQGLLNKATKHLPLAIKAENDKMTTHLVAAPECAMCTKPVSNFIFRSHFQNFL